MHAHAHFPFQCIPDTKKQKTKNKIFNIKIKSDIRKPFN